MTLKVSKKKYYPKTMPCPGCGRMTTYYASTPVVFTLDDLHKRKYECECCNTRWTAIGVRGI